MTSKTDTARRRFFRQAGAALSAPLAVAAMPASGADAEHEALKARLAALEDERAIRELHHAYVAHLNAGARDAAEPLFPGLAGTAPDERLRGVSAGPPERRDVVEIAADGRAAVARVHCIAQIETPIEPDCPLVRMAREQGGGVSRRSESGVLEYACVKRNGAWKILRATWRSA